MSDSELWTEVDSVLEGALLAGDPDLGWVLEATREAGLPEIQVSPPYGKLLQLLVRVQGSRRVLELGTLGGYSTIWMASALPADGTLISLEADPKHAQVARANLERAGVGDKVEVIVGPALETLPRLEDRAPFDLVFIDADKTGYPEYLTWAHRLARPGTLIVADNVVRSGKVASPEDEAASAVRRYLEQAGTTPGLTGTAIQTVGSKGYDGFSLTLVTSLP